MLVSGKGLEMILHKKDIVNKIAERTGFRKQDIAIMLSEMKDVMREELVKGNSVSIRNLFTLAPTIRTGNKYNLISEEVEYKEEYVSVKAIPSKRLRQYVRENSKLTKRNKQKVYEKQMALLQKRMELLNDETEEQQ